MFKLLYQYQCIRNGINNEIASQASLYSNHSTFPDNSKIQYFLMIHFLYFQMINESDWFGFEYNASSIQLSVAIVKELLD